METHRSLYSDLVVIFEKAKKHETELTKTKTKYEEKLHAIIDLEC